MIEAGLHSAPAPDAPTSASCRPLVTSSSPQKGRRAEGAAQPGRAAAWKEGGWPLSRSPLTPGSRVSRWPRGPKSEGQSQERPPCLLTPRQLSSRSPALTTETPLPSECRAFSRMPMGGPDLGGLGGPLASWYPRRLSQEVGPGLSKGPGVPGGHLDSQQSSQDQKGSLGPQLGSPPHQLSECPGGQSSTRKERQRPAHSSGVMPTGLQGGAVSMQTPDSRRDRAKQKAHHIPPGRARTTDTQATWRGGGGCRLSPRSPSQGLWVGAPSAFTVLGLRDARGQRARASSGPPPPHPPGRRTAVEFSVALLGRRQGRWQVCWALARSGRSISAPGPNEVTHLASPAVSPAGEPGGRQPSRPAAQPHAGGGCEARARAAQGDGH